MNLITSGNQNFKPQKNNIFFKLLKPANRKKSVAAVNLFDTECNELIESIRNAKSEWENASLNFEYAEDKELIDYFTYMIKACEIRYEYFLKKAKEKGIGINL